MATVTIENPPPGGSGYTTEKKAQEYIDRGRAVMVDGCLRFLTRDELRARRGLVDRRLMCYWNGARSRYLQDTDINLSMYPPGCNVSFPRGGTLAAARRYA